MTEQGRESSSLSSEKAFRVIFLVLGIIGCVIVAMLMRILIVWFLLLPIEPSALVEDPVGLTMKAMNIVLVFFSIVAVLLAFFGFREAGIRQKMREEETQTHQKLRKEAGEVMNKVTKVAKDLARESKERERESKNMNKLNIIRIFVHLGDYDRASYVLDDIKESFSWEVPFFRAIVSREQGNYKDALRYLEETLQRSDLVERREKARVYFHRGSTYIGIEDWEKADLDYDKCLELAPHYLGAYLNKAYICKNKPQEDLNGAIELINKALKINEKKPSCYFNRACYYSLKGEKTKMEEDLKEAFKFDKKWVCHALVDKDFIQNKDIVKKTMNF